MANRLSQRYFQVLDDLGFASKMIDKLTESLVEMTINLKRPGKQIRSMQKKWRKIRDNFASKNGKCLKSLFSHEATMTCLACDGGWTKHLIQVERILKLGHLYIDFNSCKKVVENCSEFFEKMFRFYSLILTLELGFKMKMTPDEMLKEEVLLSQGDKSLRQFFVVYENLRKCLQERDCINMCQSMLKPYGFNKASLLMPRKDILDRTAYFFEMSYKAENRDLRILQEVDFDWIFENLVKVFEDNDQFDLEEVYRNMVKKEEQRRVMQQIEQEEGTADLNTDEELEIVNLNTRFTLSHSLRLDSYELGFKQNLARGFVITDFLSSQFLKFLPILLIPLTSLIY